MEDFARDRGKEARLTTRGFRPGIKVHRAENGVERRIGASRDGQLQPAVDEQVSRASRLGKQHWVLVAHRNNRRAQSDVFGMLAGRREER